MKYAITTAQLIAIMLFKIHGLLKVRVYSRTLNANLLNPETTYILVSNHKTLADAFIIPSSLPLSVSIKLLPIRYFIKNSYFKNPVLRPFLILLGCFPAHPYRKWGYGIEKAIDVMGKGHSVYIFPEGKLTKIDRMNPPKKGVTLLANQKGSSILPVRIDKQKTDWHRSVKVSWGVPFDGKNMTAEQIMDVVYGLKFR